MSNICMCNKETYGIENSERSVAIAKNILNKAIVKFYTNPSNEYSVSVMNGILLNIKYSTHENYIVQIELIAGDKVVSSVNMDLSNYNYSLPGLLGNAELEVARLLTLVGL